MRCASISATPQTIGTKGGYGYETIPAASWKRDGRTTTECVAEYVLINYLIGPPQGSGLGHYNASFIAIVLCLPDV